MATVKTTNITIPDQLLDPFLKKIQHGSAIAQLSTPEPMKFGKGVWSKFDIGEAEFVGESANKSGSTVTKTSGAIMPYKFQKTLRFSNEVEWANEEHRLMVIETLLAQMPRPLSRALDFGVVHAMNPATLTTVPAMVTAGYLANASSQNEATGDIIADLDAAYAAVLGNGYVPNGVALAPAYAVDAVLARNTATNGDRSKLFPEFRPTTEVSSLDAFRASTSDTIGQGDVLAIAGDFDAVRWGVQKEIGIHKIEYGDPDGGGDLQRTNEVAFRAEIVYGWGIADEAAFSVITAEEEE